MEELIKRYIAIPMAITVFKQDMKQFEDFKNGNIYLDMLESIIDRMQQDYFQLKRELITKHHIDIKKIEKGKYEINKEIVEFSPEELKKFTEKVMSDYLHGDNARGFERKERPRYD